VYVLQLQAKPWASVCGNSEVLPVFAAPCTSASYVFGCSGPLVFYCRTVEQTFGILKKVGALAALLLASLRAGTVFVAMCADVRVPGGARGD